MKINIKMPVNVKQILSIFQNEGYEAYIVGGCVRDSLLNREINDWDICTSAKPEQMVEICKKMNLKYVPTGLKHGTITILISNVGYEVTTFRIDGDYSDNRHPNNVEFTSNLREDLSRRDFTINAMAYNEFAGLIDPFLGYEDLKNKIIKCVGNPKDRFKEDALRMMRAVRFSCQLGFVLNEDVFNSITILNENIKYISKERIRDEFCKILISNNAVKGICNLMDTYLMENIIPELNKCVAFNQHNKHHDQDVFKHTLSVVENISPKLELRLAALLHDIGKPECFTIDSKGEGHFIGHNQISADKARGILNRLKFDNKTIDKVCLLVYEHMSKHELLNNKTKKKFINRVGTDNLDDLFELQIADIKASAKEYQDFSQVLKLKEDCRRILTEKEPLKIKDLKINGNDLIKLGINPGKEVGLILNSLLEEVLEDPGINEREKLLEIVKAR